MGDEWRTQDIVETPDICEPHTASGSSGPPGTRAENYGDARGFQLFSRTGCEGRMHFDPIAQRERMANLISEGVPSANGQHPLQCHTLLEDNPRRHRIVQIPSSMLQGCEELVETYENNPDVPRGTCKTRALCEPVLQGSDVKSVKRLRLRNLNEVERPLGLSGETQERAMDSQFRTGEAESVLAHPDDKESTFPEPDPTREKSDDGDRNSQIPSQVIPDQSICEPSTRKIYGVEAKWNYQQWRC